MTVPWKPPLLQRFYTALGVIGGILLAIFGIYAISRGILITGTIMLLLACCGFIGLVRVYLKNYERQISVISIMIILAIGVLTAYAIENIYLRALMLVVTLAWSFFVVLAIYNMFIKKKQPKISG